MGTCCPPETRTTRLALVLEAEGRRYSVRLWDWTTDECAVVRLTDLETGERFRVINLSNLGLKFNRKCTCSCEPDQVTSRCVHARALKLVNLV